MGARLIKTGLSVTIASAICHFFQLPIIFAALSAVVNIKPSVVQSWKNAGEQIVVHLMGVFVAFVIGLTLGSNPLTMGLATVLVIWFCERLDLTAGTLVAVITTIFILSSTTEAQFAANALLRSGSIIIGLVVALAVNYFILPPRYGQKLRQVLKQLTILTNDFFVETVQRFVAAQPWQEAELAERKMLIDETIHTAEDLLTRYRQQFGRLRPRGTQAYNNPPYLESYLSYLTGLMERSLDLTQILADRVGRREAQGNPPVSEDFSRLLAMLRLGSDSIDTLNTQLMQTVFEAKPVEALPKTPGYWDQVAAILETWHEKVSGPYYLYALVEIGAVIGNIKWAAGRVRSLFGEIEIKRERPSGGDANVQRSNH